MGSDVEEITDDALNISTNLSTGGLVGFEDGKFGTGKNPLAGGVVDLLKEVTGAKAAEEANAAARSRFEEEKKKAEESRKAQKNQTAREQLAASRSAGSVRSGSTKTSTSGSRFSSLGGSDETDFLGL